MRRWRRFPLLLALLALVSTSLGAIAAPLVTQLELTSAIDYRGVAHLKLQTLDPTFAAEKTLTAELESGQPFEFSISNNAVFNLLAPEEQFADSHSVLRLQNIDHSKLWRLRLNWSTHFNPPLQRVEEGRPDGVHVSVDGVDGHGFVTTSTARLAYRFSNGPLLQADSLFIDLASKGEARNVASWFKLSDNGRKLTLKPEHLAELLNVVRTNGGAQLSFSLSSADYAKTVGFFHMLTPAQNTLTLTFLNSDNSPATDLAGTRFVVRHVNQALAYSVIGTMDAGGRARFFDLPQGQYEVEEVALHNEAPLKGKTNLSGSATNFDLIIKVPPEHAGHLGNDQYTAVTQTRPCEKHPSRPCPFHASPDSTHLHSRLAHDNDKASLKINQEEFHMHRFQHFCQTLSRFALLATLSGAVLAASPFPGDVPGGADHPLVKRFTGSSLIGLKVTDWDQATLPMSLPQAADASKLQEKLVVEGKVTRLAYLSPIGKTPLEVFRNYEQALDAAGFKKKYACDTGCGDLYFAWSKADDPDAGMKWSKGSIPAATGTGTFNVQSPLDPYGRMLVGTIAKGGQDLHVLLYTSNAANEATHMAATYLVIVEPKAMPTGQVTVDASAMKSGLQADGKIALYGLFFDTGKFDVKPESKAQLEGVSQEVV